MSVVSLEYKQVEDRPSVCSLIADGTYIIFIMDFLGGLKVKTQTCICNHFFTNTLEC